jgi:hypothetical protein
LLVEDPDALFRHVDYEAIYVYSVELVFLTELWHDRTSGTTAFN